MSNVPSVWGGGAEWGAAETDGANAYWGPARPTTPSELLASSWWRLSETSGTVADTIGGITGTVQGAAAGPAFSNITKETPTTTGIAISWNVTPASQGQIEYGTTTSYGSTTTLETNYLTYHRQVISGLTPGTTYYFRLIGTTAGAVTGYSARGSFTTLASAAVSMYTPNLYGSGFAMDSKANTYIGGPNYADISVRFRARTDSALNSVVWQIRRGGGYSAGTSGTVRISLRADDGSTSHLPTGVDLTYEDVGGAADNGGAAGGYVIRTTFSSPYTVTAGTLYHLVFTNVDAAPATNYVSINHSYLVNAESNSIGTRQPAFRDDFAVLSTDPDGYTTGTAFSLISHYSPDVDLTYADASHDGCAYLQGSNVNSGQYAVITGANYRARERFTVSGGDRTAIAVYVRVGRQSGSGDLRLVVKDSGGTVVGTVLVPAASVPVVPVDTGDDNGAWVGGAFASSVTLTNAAQFDLELYTDATTQYTAVPMLSRDGSDNGTDYMQSFSFTDGTAQKTTDGSTWGGIVSGGFTQNLMFYFVTTS